MDTPQTGTAQYLSFFVGAEEYALGILEVTELVEFRPVTKVPSMPPYVMGVVNVRGRVVPVVDLAARFGFGESTVGKWSCIVLVDTDAGRKMGVVGLLADRVSEVVELASGDLQPPPQFGTQVRREYLRAVGRAGDRFVLLLDVARVLGEDLGELDAGLQAAVSPSSPSPASGG